MLQPGNGKELEAISNSYLLELSIVAAQGQDKIQEDMKNFAEKLKSLVHLEEVDHKRLQNTP